MVKKLLIPSLIFALGNPSLTEPSCYHFSGEHLFIHVVVVVFSHSLVSNPLWPMDCSTPGFPVLHYLLEFAQTHVHWVTDAIQPSHPLLPPSPPALHLSQHQGLFQWVSSSHQVAKVLEPQLQSFQWSKDWLIWSPCSPRDFQESSPTPQIKSINASALYSPIIPSIHG